MSNYPKLTNYVSEIDQVLQAFDHEHPELSLSQRYEKEKYRRVYFLRDNIEQLSPIVKFWEKF